ncbi:MAG TPA: PP2C family serine/threonine-protein phosphatase, partial [Chloroflexota bacterium]
PRGEEGARLACTAFVETVSDLYLPEHGDQAPVVLDRRAWWARLVEAWLSRFQGRVGLAAEQDGRDRRGFACTFLGAVVADGWAGLVQIGDGAIVVDDGGGPDRYAPFVWPRRGEYANETYFATDDRAAEHVDLDLLPRRIDEIALLTDGLQGLVLDYARRAPHGPFFARVFAPFRAASDDCAALSAQLAAFLASPRVRARTDDDTTLILATRRTERLDRTGTSSGAGL